MLKNPLTAWLRPVLTLLALAGVLALTACGGGNGAPNNQFDRPTAVAVTPSSGTTAPHSPFTFTVTGGSSPYFLFSSDPGIASVPASIAGNTFTVTPGDVSVATGVTITVRDSNGTSTTALLNVSATKTLVVLPATADVFSGVPATLSITGGSPPYTAVSSNASVLPVPSTVSTTVPLLAANVTAATPVVVTIQDSTGQTASATLSVKPSVLLPASITITGNPNCSASGAQLCSGQDGSATVTVTGGTGASVAGRQIKFDVVVGTYSLVATNSAVPAQSVTVLTDQNGLAAVTIRVPVTAVTQYATIRATDVTSGSSVVGQFTIAQFVNGNSVLSVIPTGTTTFTGPDKTKCASGGVASFYVFGGTPPYTVQTNFPTAITLTGSPVATSGGAFSVSPNGTCFTGLTFAITDAAGRTLLTPPTVDNVLGTLDAPAQPILLTPSSIGPVACNAGAQIGQIIATGGTGTYTVGVVSAGGTGTPIVATAASGLITVTGGAGGAAHGDWTINVSSGSLQTATVHCT